MVRLFNTIQYNQLPFGIACEILSYMMMCGGAVVLVVALLGMIGALKSTKGCIWVVSIVTHQHQRIPYFECLGLQKFVSLLVGISTICI